VAQAQQVARAWGRRRARSPGESVFANLIPKSLTPLPRYSHAVKSKPLAPIVSIFDKVGGSDADLFADVDVLPARVQWGPQHGYGISQSHPRELWRDPASRYQLTLSGAAPAGAPKVDRRGLENFRKQTARSRLSPGHRGNLRSHFIFCEPAHSEDRSADGPRRAAPRCSEAGPA
jgi:hypothetical protein